MKLSEERIETRAIQALLECLKVVPFVVVSDWEQEPVIENTRPAGIVRLRLPKTEKVLIVEAKSNGQPRYARGAVNQLLRFTQAMPGAYGVFVAPYISPASANICRSEGVGYVDLAGNCFLSFDEIHIEREGRPNPFGEKRDLRALYSAKAERVLRVLLAGTGSRWTITDLAAEADVSLGHTYNVKELLADREWLDVNKDGVALDKPALLLADWAQNYRFARNEKNGYYLMKPVNEIEAALGEICLAQGISFALTGFSGAARLAPVVRYQRAQCYLEFGAETISDELGLKRVSSGANVQILTPYDEGVFYGAQQVDGIQIAHPVQVYLDLLHESGRAQEAADFLWEQVLETQWQPRA